MTSGVDGSNSDRSSVGGPSDVSGPDASRDVDAEARADLSSAADAVPDAEASRVADEVVGDVDAVEIGASASPAPAGGPAAVEDEAKLDPAAVPGAFEPNPANRAAADAFNDELHAIEENNSLGFDKQDARAEVLGRIAEHAQAIPDLDERDRFVRAVAPDAGHAAGMYAGRAPMGAFNKLDAIGQGVHPDTGRLLAHGALSTGPGQDNLLPMGRSGSPVGDALVEAKQGRTQRAGELLGDVARTVVPGVDATVRAVQGDYGGAAASLGVDLAGGAILRGGKLAVGAATGALALAPQDAQAGVLSRLTMKYGDEVVEFESRRGLVKGRTPTFDVNVPGRFADGTPGTLRLADSRAKHNALGDNFGGANLDRLAKDVSRGRGPAELSGTRSIGQFTGRFNTEAGQAELARMVMERVTPEQLAAVGRSGGALELRMPVSVGLTPNGGGKVVTANSVRVMRNNDGGFHLVPVP